MAYIPTRADFIQQQPQAQPQRSGGYRPTRADFMSLNTPQAEPESPGFMRNTADALMHIPAALATSGRNTLNTLQKNLKSGSRNDLSKDLSKIGVKNVQRGENEKNYDYYQAMGLNKGGADELATGLLDFAPYMAGGSGAVKVGGKLLSESPAMASKLSSFAGKYPKLAKYLPEAASNAVSGGAYGYNNAPEGSEGTHALLSAGLSVLPTAASALVIDPLLRYGAKKYAQSAIPKFTEKATDKLRELLPVDQYVRKLSDRFMGATSKNKANWQELNNTARGLDEGLISPMRAQGREMPIKGNNKIQNEVENTDHMGNPLNPLMLGKQAPLKQEIVGYDAGGAPIFSKHDYGAEIKEFPSTRNISGSVPRRTSAISGEYDAAGAPLYKNGINFNSSPLKSYIEGFKNKVGAMEPAQQQEYTQALKLANKASELSPRSFSGAVSLRKNINQDMKDYLNQNGIGYTPQNSQSKNFLSGLKQNLKNETIAAQEGKVAPEALDQFRNQWETANKSHQDIQKFYKSPNKMTGVENEGKVLREAYKSSLPKEMGGTNTPMDPAILSKYVPSLSPTGSKGVEGLKHLEKLMGSKEDAVAAAKSHIFGKQIQNGANTVDTAAKYAQLSPAQKKYLFGDSKEGEMLEAINKTRLAFGREPEKTLAKVGHGLMGWGVPGLLGYEASEAAGESKAKSFQHALEAIAASKGLKYAAKASATVPRVNRAISFGKNGTTNTGRNTNMLLQALLNQPQQRNQ